MEPGPLGGVPDPDGLVLRVGEDQVPPRVEDHTRHVVVVPKVKVTRVFLQSARGMESMDIDVEG